MKRRTGAGGATSKARGRKTARPNRRNVPNAVACGTSSPPSHEADLTQLRRELNEAREQQTATSEVLQVISSSPGDLEPVFAAMLKNAVRVCNASFGNIYRWDGEVFSLLATYNTPPAFVEYRKHSPSVSADPGSAFGRIVATKTTVHIHDARTLEAYVERSNPGLVAAVELGGTRTHLFVPLLKEDELLGVFTVFRPEVHPFTEKQIELGCVDKFNPVARGCEI
jgi:two-component system, NtrC family, sensor kinase